MTSKTIEPSSDMTAILITMEENDWNSYVVDPASLTLNEVEDFIVNRVKKRVMKTKEYQRAEASQQKPKGFWARLWHGFKKCVSWLWEKFCKLMDMLITATANVVRFIWNNGGEDHLRAYVARELTALIRY